MKKGIVGILIAFVLLFAFAECSAYTKVDPMVKKAYSSLSIREKFEIKGKWKAAKIKKDTMNQNIVALKQIENGTKIYSITFPTTSNSLGDIVVYVDSDKQMIVGKGMRE